MYNVSDLELYYAEDFVRTACHSHYDGGFHTVEQVLVLLIRFRSVPSLPASSEVVPSGKFQAQLCCAL